MMQYMVKSVKIMHYAESGALWVIHIHKLDIGWIYLPFLRKIREYFVSQMNSDSYYCKTLLI